MILVGMLGYSVLGCEEACWHCLFLAMPDPWSSSENALQEEWHKAGRAGKHQIRWKKALNVLHAW